MTKTLFALCFVAALCGCGRSLETPMEYLIETQKPDLLQAADMRTVDLAPVPDLMPRICPIVRLGEDTFPNASNLRFTCSPKAATCLLSYLEGKKATQRLYLIDGTKEPSHPLPYATAPNNPVLFLIGTPDGFLASVWEATGPLSVRNWLLRTDDLGIVQQATPTLINIDGVADVGVSTNNGEWVASAVWLNKMGSYHLGRVDAQANVVDAQSFATPNGACLIYPATHIAEQDGVVAVMTETSNLTKPNETRMVSVFLKHGSDPVNELSISGAEEVANYASCGVYLSIGIAGFGGSFTAAWHDPNTDKTYATTITLDGKFSNRIDIGDRDLRDFVSVKGGFATVSYSPTGQVLTFQVRNQDWYAETTATIQPTTMDEGPFVAVDGLNDGRFAVTWIDSQFVGHVIFFAYDKC